ncbi:hypothetical protein CA234_03075 [Sphingomonas sp. ABOLE]|uniref:head-tail joining protein n=1 Tax=Sphingomonas sp. ABOLE TaxID=1985878 RepID=UPI000F7DDD8D|nr:hypothetical protein [Sphingomonas sp. ABOLE]RSV44412.1 hypothetical protein CA234_03075 [Sphingomonas sp. ABOLE]
MPIESAADRAALFNEDELATPAVYTAPAGGPALRCSVIFDVERSDPLDVGTDGGARSVRTWQGAQVLADQVPQVEQKGRLQLGSMSAGAFVPDGLLLEVIGRPKRDVSGEVWDVTVREVA